MPYQLAPPCKKQGCPNLSHDDTGYCAHHRKEAQQQQDKQRGSATLRGYDRQWRKRRQRYLIENPLCVECAPLGRVVAAVVVDHIIPHKDNYTLFGDEGNWQSLCKECHDRKTAKQDGAFGNRG